MIKHMLSHIRWDGLIATVFAVGLILIFNRCEKNPVITSMPIDQVEFSQTQYAVNDTTFYRAATHGSSHTLYAGLIDQERPEEESAILIRFADVDSTQLAKFQSAQLLLFRRTVGVDTLPKPSLEFYLSFVESPANDTIWTESDTAGHVEMESLETELMKTASLSNDSVAVPTSSTDADIRDDLEYLAFSVDATTLSSWSEGEIANNGFLVQQSNSSELIGFHSRNAAGLHPYLALTFTDTSSTGEEDTTITYYYHPSEDLSVYSSYQEDPVYYDGSLHLDHSNGIRAHIELDADFQVDTTSTILGARMVLYAKPSVITNQVSIEILRRLQSLDDGDSTIFFTTVTYTEGSDSITFNLYDYLFNLVAGTYDNYGLDLVVRPYNHDFDHLIFWGAEAVDALKPRVVVDYGSFTRR